MIEIGLGHYPYPPETYSNVFAQLTAIVHGEPPNLPGYHSDDLDGIVEEEDSVNVNGKRKERYSEDARDWVSRCLVKNPEGRASYAELLVSAPIATPFFFLLVLYSTVIITGTPFLGCGLETRSRHGRVGAACVGLSSSSRVATSRRSGPFGIILFWRTALIELLPAMGDSGDENDEQRWRDRVEEGGCLFSSNCRQHLIQQIATPHIPIRNSYSHSFILATWRSRHSQDRSFSLR